MKTIAYIRISDADKQDSQSQISSVHQYAKDNGYVITDVVEEHISASKTDVTDRELSKHISSGHRIIMTDATRLGRRKVFDLLGVIGKICSNGGELHFSYTNRQINESNMDDAETIFTMVGQSYAATEESKARSNRAKAAHARRKAAGLHVGRKHGAVVKSKLDDHLPQITAWLKAGVPKTEIIKKLEKKGCTITRTALYNWIRNRNIAA